MFSIATAPAKQSVGETISVLSGRLSSSTLLEDRRAAIQGLRSFAKDYPASVASGALRSLIGSLGKDGDDVDTVKVVLETLLMLFNPNQNSPEASDEIVLWLADEFTQRQENITLLLDFLETNDFYSRLYSLQLLSAILSARTERTEECVFTAPLGISRLVAILDDRREAIRNEGITLLTYLTPSSTDIQKLVAFEDAFKKIFAIIAAEGSLLEGGQVIEDCLILMANLLRLNSSNQSQFRETGCVPQLSQLLQTAYQVPEDGQEVAPWAQVQRNRNVYALLAVIRMFLVQGAVGTIQNQRAFWQHNVLYHALQLAFSHTAEIPIKAEALVTCADIIRGNTTLQENFAQLQVPSPLEEAPAAPNGNGPEAKAVPKVYVIDGLLDLALCVRTLQAFDMRMSACECLKAYFYSHDGIREHFLRRAIDGHKSGAIEDANVLTTLLRSPTEDSTVDPYRYWFAACIMLHLTFENATTKELARQVTEGNEAEGEEVVTSIQIITSHLVGCLSRSEDERVITGYLMLLLCWLFEDLDGVNDLLEEGSNFQRLIQTVVKNSSSETIVQGLSAMLLGVIYEFSTKDSTVPRATLQSILMSNMGRDKYIDKLSKLRAHPAVRDFEMIPQKLDPSTGALPDVYFDSTFVEFFKDNYSRILRAIDRDPGMEISVMTNGVQKGISRELVDSLRTQLDERENALQECQANVAHLEQQLGQFQADARRHSETHSLEILRIKAVNEGLQQNHEQELRQVREQHSQREKELQGHIDTARRTAEAEYERLQKKADADLRAKDIEIERLQKKAADELRAKVEEHERLQKKADGELQAKIREYENRLIQMEEEFKKEVERKDKQHEEEKEALRKETEKGHKRRQSEADRTSRRAEAEKADLKATISRLEVDVLKANKSKSQEVQAAKDASEQAQKKVAELETKISGLQKQLQEVKEEVTAKESEKESIQGELDDLLMVYADNEEKLNKYKERLKEKGEVISDDEGDDDDDDDDDDDEEEEGEEEGDKADEKEEEAE